MVEIGENAKTSRETLLKRLRRIEGQIRQQTGRLLISRVFVFPYHMFSECDTISLMWPFRRKKIQHESLRSGAPCPHCGSTNTRLIVYHGTNHPDYVRIWRGQRGLTYRCFDCGLDFYGQEPQEEIIEGLLADDQVVDDEEALRTAEDEVRREIEEDGDRRCW